MLIARRSPRDSKTHLKVQVWQCEVDKLKSFVSVCAQSVRFPRSLYLLMLPSAGLRVSSPELHKHTTCSRDLWFWKPYTEPYMKSRGFTTTCAMGRASRPRFHVTPSPTTWHLRWASLCYGEVRRNACVTPPFSTVVAACRTCGRSIR